MSEIELRNLSTGYRHAGGVTVVSSGLNAAIGAGRLTCLLGTNGAGKSTLLRTLAAFQPALEGEVLIEGRRLDDYRNSELARLIGVVLTDRISVDNLSVGELVAMGRSPYTGFWGANTDDDRLACEQALAQVGAQQMASRKVHTLSDGERQKVMIAKALAQQTPVIYLDEPTAFLDYTSKVDLMRLLQRLAHESGKTVFLSTHDIELALLMADDIWLLDKRLGLVTGTPDQVVRQGHLVRCFPGIDQILISVARIAGKM